MAIRTYRACHGPHCKALAELCDLDFCGVCCRKIHSTTAGHTFAPLLSEVNVLGSNWKKDSIKEVEKIPEPGKIEKAPEGELVNTKWQSTAKGRVFD